MQKKAECNAQRDIVCKELPHNNDAKPRYKALANVNKCIGDDTKAATRQSPNCIKKTKTRGQSNLTKSASRGPISRLGVTPGGRKLYRWIPGVGFPISVP